MMNKPNAALERKRAFLKLLLKQRRKILRKQVDEFLKRESQLPPEQRTYGPMQSPSPISPQVEAVRRLIEGEK